MVTDRDFYTVNG